MTGDEGFKVTKIYNRAVFVVRWILGRRSSFALPLSPVLLRLRRLAGRNVLVFLGGRLRTSGRLVLGNRFSSWGRVLACVLRELFTPTGRVLMLLLRRVLWPVLWLGVCEIPLSSAVRVCSGVTGTNGWSGGRRCPSRFWRRSRHCHRRQRCCGCERTRGCVLCCSWNKLSLFIVCVHIKKKLLISYRYC